MNQGQLYYPSSSASNQPHPIYSQMMPNAGAYGGCANISSHQANFSALPNVYQPNAQHHAASSGERYTTSNNYSIGQHSTQRAMNDPTFGPQAVVRRAPVRLIPSLNPFMSILNIPVKLALQLRKELTMNCNWCRLAEVAENTQFALSMSDFRVIECDNNSSEALLSTFGNLSMTLQTLAEMLDLAGLYETLNMIRLPEPVRITQQPESDMVITESETLILVCRADGFPAPDYQWYQHFNGQSIKLPHQNSGRLIIDDVSALHAGSYVCQAYNITTPKSDIPQSQYSTVTVKPNPKHKTRPNKEDCPRKLSHLQCPEAEQNIAQAKIAFLVGTAKYFVGFEELPAVRRDILDLEKNLKKMNFKVLTLLNLKKDEVIQHVNWFSKLLSEGVYGLFFYIGHGFKHQEQSFLIPFDAPIDCQIHHCIHLEKHVLLPILQQKPSMCCAIIDICRESIGSVSKDVITEEVKLPPNDTTCIMHATSSGYKSWESQETQQGIFMTALSKHINEKISLHDLFTRVRREIKEENAPQYPEMKTHLSKSLSLHDPIVTEGHTKVVNRRHMEWENAHRLPEGLLIMVKEVGFKLRVSFTKEMSNEMTMITQVVDMGSVISYSFTVNDVPPEIVGAQNKVQNVKRPGIQFRTTFHDLQRLKNSLRPSLQMKLDIQHLNADKFHQLNRTEVLDLGKPLVSSLHLHDRSM